MKRPIDSVEHERYVKAEIAEIERAKWIESEKANKDLGKDAQGRPSDTFTISWIGEHGEEFRDKWEQSQCKTCQCYGCVEEPKKKCYKQIDSLRIRVIKDMGKMIDFEVINIDTHEIIGRYYLVPTKNKDDIEPKVLYHGSTRRKATIFHKIVDVIFKK